MTIKTVFGAVALLVLAGLSAPTIVAETPEAPLAAIRRFALVAGSNGGSAGQVRLKYAASDARSFASVLTELGGVSKGDLILLVDPSLAVLRDALGRMRTMIAGAERSGEKSEFVVYYSGHSDDNGLLLGGERLGYEALRKDIEGIGADLRVAIVDSCSSGSLTRAKGGTSRPAFLFDASSDMTGHAFLTASSADESAQESDRLGGSFFTHFLVSGLRGAADLDGKGLVTLNEAYAFAFRETLASTENTKYGAQHPAYEINLTGSGDLVFTDLRATTGGLSLAKDLAGRIYIRDARGLLAVELGKPEGKAMDIGLEPGRYDIVLDREGGRYRGTVSVGDKRRTLVSASDLVWYPAEAATARGNEAPGPETDATAIRVSPISFNLLPELPGGLFSSDSDRRVSINILIGSTASLSGFEVAGLVNAESRHVTGFQAAGLGNLVAGDVSGFQAAGLANYAGGDLVFVQAAGLVNYAGGALRGVQAAGLGNLANGRLAGTGGAAGEAARGAQFAGLANFNFGDSEGTQAAGILNYARGLVKGAQLAGIVNYAGAVSGAQVGVVNVGGRIAGTQIGLVNIAHRIEGFPVGLISIEDGGIFNLEATWGGSGTEVDLGLKVGTRHTFTRFGLGHPFDRSSDLWSFGIGLGGRIGLGSLFIDGELGTRATLSLSTPIRSYEDITQTQELRLVLGVPTRALSLVVGAALDFTYGELWALLNGADPLHIGLTPRFIGGIQL
jgi:hypothetical protein